ncbi:MAG TPA: glycine cleavage system aminomethyltransferase GcvT [Candidatus Bathyarchaeia archaeon]|nr:glycine cleavage system aminomethyltransferase GcvT [Candidatus Bathyarchaeia archaeon]
MARRTHVYEYHRKHGNVVEYAGFDLSVWFEGIIPECHSVRNNCGIFDVSHMGRVLAEGKGAESFLNQLTTNDVSKLAVGRGQYSLLCNPKGGIMDDLTIFRIGSIRYLVVYNAGNRDKNWNWLLKNRPRDDVTLSDVSDNVAMFAVQGPRAGVVLWNVSGVKLEEVEKYGRRDVKVAGVPCLLTRSGYTGEDGFEIYVWNTSVKEPSNAVKVWEKLLSGGRELGICPVGLGARDVLRLEAGMCLYGNDIDENTSPVEAKLNWVVRLEKPDFVGKNVIVGLKEKGPNRVRVGFKMKERGIPRQSQDIFVDAKAVGKVSSGTFSPTLSVGVGMGYIPASLAAVGETISVGIRDRRVQAEVVKLPFYQRRSESQVVVFGEEMGLKDFRKKYSPSSQSTVGNCDSLSK